MERTELHDQLVQQVTNIITAHRTNEIGVCKLCQKDLYNSGGGMTLSRHHAEMIVDRMGLVALFAKQSVPQGESDNAIPEATPREPETC